MADMVTLSRFTSMVSGLGQKLGEDLRLDLKSDVRSDSKGSLEGRVYLENPHFNFHFVLTRITLKNGPSKTKNYVVQVRTGLIPGVNGFAQYFPLTQSRATVNRVAQTVRQQIVASEPRDADIAVTIEGEVSSDAFLLVLAEGGPLGFAGGLIGYIIGGTPGLYEGVVGGVIVGAGTVLLFIFRMFD